MIKFENGKLVGKIEEEIKRELKEQPVELTDEIIKSIKEKINSMINQEYFQRFIDECKGFDINISHTYRQGYETKEIIITSNLLIERILLEKSEEFNPHVFIDAIKKLESSDIEKRDFLSDSKVYKTLNKEQKQLIDNIERLACEYIINKDCSVSYSTISKLRNYDIIIKPGEQDSFGWLTGCVYTKKGIVVFG